MHGEREKAMDQLLQHALNALILGGTYALLGIGLTLIFGIMRVVNFTHGELYAFGAYMMYLWVMLLGVNFYLALPLAVVLGVALGAPSRLVLLRRLQGRRHRHHHAGDDRRLDRAAECRAAHLVGRRQVDQQSVPVLALGAGLGVGVVEPPVRVRGRSP